MSGDRLLREGSLFDVLKAPRKARLKAERVHPAKDEEAKGDADADKVERAFTSAEEREDPEREAGDQEEDERARYPHHAGHLADNEEEPDRRPEEKESEELLELIHPFARLRQKACRRRDDGEQHKRRGEPERDEAEDEDDHRRIARKGKANRRAEEGRRTRRRQDDREHALEEGAREPIAAIGLRAERACADLDLKDAKEVQREDKEDGGEEGREDRRLKLKAPADFRPCRAKPDDEGGERHQRREDTARIRPGVSEAARARIPGEANKPKDLEREHGQHAGHHVQDDAAKESEEDQQPEAQGRVRVRGRRYRARTASSLMILIERPSEERALARRTLSVFSGALKREREFNRKRSAIALEREDAREGGLSIYARRARRDLKIDHAPREDIRMRP